MIFGYFNIDRIIESKEMKDHENLLTAFDYRKQNKLSSRVAPTPATCSDQILPSILVSTEAVNTSFSDNYSVLGEVTDIFLKTKQQTFLKIVCLDCIELDIKHIVKKKPLIGSTQKLSGSNLSLIFRSLEQVIFFMFLTDSNKTWLSNNANLKVL